MDMEGLPFEIPRSLSSYITQFETDPDKGIANLESHLKKRGMDAVGFFLLSWLYYNNEQQDQAIHYAFKAKCCAPGSPFLDRLHYFLVHPDHFQAWKPFHSESGTEEVETSTIQSGYKLNLDLLIEQLSKAENKKITIDPDKKDDRNLGEKSETVEDIASETLAKIYEKQEKFDYALNTLEKLRQSRPRKADHYSREIERIRALLSDQKSGQ